MIDSLRQEALNHGDRLAILSVNRLKEIKKYIDEFRNGEELNSFQNWIVDNIYNFQIPECGFEINSIIVVAIPHPAYAIVEFIRDGKKYNFKNLYMSDFGKSEKYLKDFILKNSYHIQPATKLPLKRLAVHSGLAVYGRNNICYVDEMGSFISFAAFYSDIPCYTDDWTEMKKADICSDCRICFNNCPTAAIKENRFLINNERCLSFINEGGGDFPEWLSASVHHCVYDCLKCQVSCPMNREYINNIDNSIKFDEEETEMLLKGIPFEELPPELKRKSMILGFNQWPDAIPRNLKMLFDLSDA